MSDEAPVTAEGIAHLLDADRAELLVACARHSAHAAIHGKPAPRFDDASIAAIRVSGAFVTMKLGGELRGCIGVLGRPYPVLEAVERAARSAAVDDPRFPPMSDQDLRSATIEVSLLTPLEWMDSADLPAAVRPGIDGLVVEEGSRRGLLLPQVASELRLDARAFLEQTCRKAGLPRDAWERGARVARFQAVVLDETRTA